MSFLSHLTNESPNSISFKASRSDQFNKSVITAHATLIEIIFVFEVDPDVQRELNTSQVASIMKYVKEKLKHGNSPIFFPPFVFSSRGHGKFNNQNYTFSLRLDNKIAVLDGQHRLEAFKNLESILKDSNDPEEQMVYERLKRIPLTLQIYEGLTIEQEQQLFTDVNAKSTKVSSNLIKYYDDFNITSRLMRKIVQNHPSIAFEQFEVRQNTTRSKLMTGLDVYKLIAVLHSGRIIKNQLAYTFPEEEFDTLYIKTKHFLTLLVKYMPTHNAYDRSKSIYLNKSIILSIAMLAFEIKDVSLWEEFFKEVIFRYNWTHSNKDLKEARVAYNYKKKRFRLTPEMKVVNVIYKSLKNNWKGI